MLEILKELRETKRPASIYTDHNSPNKFFYGYVAAVNENEAAIQMLLPDGGDDGLTVVSIDSVFRIEEKGQYEAKMNKLCVGRELPHYDDIFKSGDVKTDVLLYALREKRIVSIELRDSGYDDVTGFIEELRDGKCKIKQIDEYGENDGITYIFAVDITRVSAMSEDEKILEKLWRAGK